MRIEYVDTRKKNTSDELMYFDVFIYYIELLTNTQNTDVTMMRL